MTTEQPQRASFAIVTVILPGPDRKRTPAPYQFRVSYRNPEPTGPGCVMTWQVLGGREEYQVAAERTEGGRVEWHCTCPDAIYHEDHRNAHGCKHVQGIQALLRAAGEQVPAAA
jgi:hypothetical protein